MSWLQTQQMCWLQTPHHDAAAEPQHVSLPHTEDVSAPHRAALWSCNSTRAALRSCNSRICGLATSEIRGDKGKSGNVTKWHQMGRNGLKICPNEAKLHNQPIQTGFGPFLKTPKKYLHCPIGPMACSLIPSTVWNKVILGIVLGESLITYHGNP